MFVLYVLCVCFGDMHCFFVFFLNHTKQNNGAILCTFECNSDREPAWALSPRQATFTIPIYHSRRVCGFFKTKCLMVSGDHYVMCFIHLFVCLCVCVGEGEPQSEGKRASRSKVVKKYHIWKNDAAIFALKERALCNWARCSGDSCFHLIPSESSLWTTGLSTSSQAVFRQTHQMFHGMKGWYHCAISFKDGSCNYHVLIISLL